jgi:hypothetical protein
MNHPYEEIIINSPFTEEQKQWLKEYTTAITNVQFNDLCECDSEEETYVVLGQDGRTRCFRCRKHTEEA